MSRSLATFFWTLLSLLASVQADNFFFILSQSPALTARLDPIRAPHNVSSHAHNFVGANGVSLETGGALDIKEESDCTTSPVQQDLSIYWSPQLYSYDQQQDRFNLVEFSGANIYYLFRGKDIRAFPTDLRMIAGNASGTEPAKTKQLEAATSFQCLDYKGGSKQSYLIPTTACPDGLRAQVTFPSCWNGKDLDSANHMSHMSYPVGDTPDNGDCPPTHPIRLPTLFYEFFYKTGAETNENNSRWVFAQGDALGYGMHADFIANWNEAVLQRAIDQCTGSLFGDVEKCASLSPSINRNKASDCLGVSTERAKGWVKTLPGCNPIKNGPHKGKGQPANCPAPGTTAPSTPPPSTKPDNVTPPSNGYGSDTGFGSADGHGHFKPFGKKGCALRKRR